MHAKWLQSEVIKCQKSAFCQATLIIWCVVCARHRRCCVCCTMKPRRTCCQADIHSHRTSVTILLVYTSSSQPKNNNRRDGWQNLLMIRPNILGACNTNLCCAITTLYFVYRATCSAMLDATEDGWTLSLQCQRSEGVTTFIAVWISVTDMNVSLLQYSLHYVNLILPSVLALVVAHVIQR